MKKLITLIGFYLFVGLQVNAIANEEFISEQRDSFDTMSPEEIVAKRQEILAMSEETLERLYKEHPEAEEDLKNAYGYGVFEAKAVNIIVYVAGTGLGVVFDNKTKTPIFMNAIRGGTGPGIGYKSLHGVFIFDNETVFDQFTTVGLQLSASADAAANIAGKGTSSGTSASLVPGVSFYQLIDTGLVLQANWGATEFLKDPNLNK
jgi:lipid-binding SYLF domain-containing protein